MQPGGRCVVDGDAAREFGDGHQPLAYEGGRLPAGQGLGQPRGAGESAGAHGVGEEGDSSDRAGCGSGDGDGVGDAFGGLGGGGRSRGRGGGGGGRPGGRVEVLPWQVVKVQCSSVNRVGPLPLASKVKVSRPPAPGSGSSPESDA